MILMSNCTDCKWGIISNKVILLYHLFVVGAYRYRQMIQQKIKANDQNVDNNDKIITLAILPVPLILKTTIMSLSAAFTPYFEKTC